MALLQKKGNKRVKDESFLKVLAYLSKNPFQIPELACQQVKAQSHTVQTKVWAIF